MNVRIFADADVAAVYSIQLMCPDAAQWRKEDYLQLAHDPLGRILVAESEDVPQPQVVGFAAFHSVEHEAELRNIAVNPSDQRRGIARALLAAGIGGMQEAGVHKIFLEVRASNQPALALYSAAGFRVTGTRRGYYQNPSDDAQVMVCDLV